MVGWGAGSHSLCIWDREGEDLAAANATDASALPLAIVPRSRSDQPAQGDGNGDQEEEANKDRLHCHQCLAALGVHC